MTNAAGRILDVRKRMRQPMGGIALFLHSAWASSFLLDLECGCRYGVLPSPAPLPLPAGLMAADMFAAPVTRVVRKEDVYAVAQDFLCHSAGEQSHDQDWRYRR